MNKENASKLWKIIQEAGDYSNCQFADGQDLNGTYMPNANLSFTGFIKVTFDKSIMMNSTLANGNFQNLPFFEPICTRRILKEETLKRQILKVPI